MQWGRRKDGQPYPKRGRVSGIKQSDFSESEGITKHHFKKNDLIDNEDDLEKFAREKADRIDSGEIPPNFVYDKDALLEKNGRYYLVRESYPDIISVDEYKKLGDEFKHERTVIMVQGSEQKNDLLEITGGGYVEDGTYYLNNDKEFLDGLASAGALND